MNTGTIQSAIPRQRRTRAQRTRRALFAIAAAWLVTALCSAPTLAAPAATDYLAEYEAILYDSYDGLVSAEINAVAQTDDGYIWVGTYSGLYRYDGFRFERLVPDNRISNVMVLYVDAKGRLWIGTNDSGLCRYTPDTGEVVFYTSDDGLSADSIRALCEDDNGNIYVGTCP